MSHFRKQIDAMTAYVPGEQPRAGETVIKLNTNENPYPPSPAAMQALRTLEADALRRYPDPDSARAGAAAAAAWGVPAEWVLTGNGSDDLIVMIARACAGPGRAVAYPVPTFAFYHTQALIEAAECVEVPFEGDFELPVDALAEADGAVTFVSNPNTPTGTAVGVERLEDLAGRLSGLLVIDEAYFDFADVDAAGLPQRRENVVVLRTLSKGYSLAGLRLGFAIARPAVLAGLAKTRTIYTVDAVAGAVGAAALEDQDWKNANAEKVRSSRATLTAGLEAMGCRVWPSQANFILARPPAGDAERIHQALKAQGILVRYFNQPSVADKLRITVGTDEQNAALVEALGKL